MMRKLFYLTPLTLLLLAGCARDRSQASAQAAPGAVGYAAASQAGSPSPGATAPTTDPTTPVASAAPAPPENPEPRTPAGAVIAPGTALYVRLDETVDTRRNRPGDVVHATLARPVTADGATVLPVGTQFTGHVTMADSSGRLKGRAYIGVALDSYHVNGVPYRISTTSVDRASQAHKKRNSILIGGGAGLGAALGAIAGGGKGALIGAGAGAAAGTAGAAATGKLNVAIPAETMLRFTVRSSTGA